ncbi:MAG: choice-of-anchor tandem repeat GloVer-containing protein [Candidatus Korobacteraceae bacterium]
MIRQPQRGVALFDINPRMESLALMVIFLVAAISATPAQAQTFTILHNFTGGQDGESPGTGLSMDRAGNLYGTADGTADHDGLVFKMTNRGGNWLLTPLYNFSGEFDGVGPNTTPTIASNGILYGTTANGGSNDLGSVYRLRPPATPPRSVESPWTHTLLYSFGYERDGFGPTGELTLDQAGNIYGTTEFNGAGGNGMTYELTLSDGEWTENVLFSPTGYQGAGQIDGGVIFDNAGNLYGVMENGGQYSMGGVYELSPSSSGWSAQFIYSFADYGTGVAPVGGLIMDALGNIYGSTVTGGSGNGGIVFELSPSDGGWTFTLLANLTGPRGSGPTERLAMDAAGNVYGTTVKGGAHQFGSVFKLTPSGGGWTFTTLHDFTGTGFDGAFVYGGPLVDANNNVYGTASVAGENDKGIVWEITP